MQEIKFQLTKGSHSVGESNFHLVFTVAYRRNIFKSAHVLEQTRAYLLEKATEMKITVASLEFGPDHLHMFVGNCRRYSAETLAHDLKGFVSHEMREHHFVWIRAWLWGKKFWTRGYFYRSVGSVRADTVKFYIDHCQHKHWTVA
ncbi:MAG: IS200/IS605 family transposase [Candidatus Omnitrophica bacterium]|nr:IS200/IS605 family transposase [Candidatus Omnitrophota bacterium]